MTNIEMTGFQRALSNFEKSIHPTEGGKKFFNMQIKGRIECFVAALATPLVCAIHLAERVCQIAYELFAMLIGGLGTIFTLGKHSESLELMKKSFAAMLSDVLGAGFDIVKFIFQEISLVLGFVIHPIIGRSGFENNMISSKI